MFDDQRWRDSYDAWKLATPPEYEWGPRDEEEAEIDRIRDEIDDLMQTAESEADFRKIIELSQLIGEDIDLPPTLEEALASPPLKIDADAEDDPADLEIVF